MEKLELPKSVLIKEIIRYDEDMYLLDMEAEFCKGWESCKQTLFVRTDVKALAEMLRLENSTQTTKIEDVFLTMLSHGEPPRIDIRKLTGHYLELCSATIVVRKISSEDEPESVNDLPQLVDVFPLLVTEPLDKFLYIENEFSKDILEKTFADFQKTFALMERGYSVENASSMTQTDNPISAMIYQKIKQQLHPEEPIIVVQGREEKLEENYARELVESKNETLPF